MTDTFALAVRNMIKPLFTYPDRRLTRRATVVLLLSLIAAIQLCFGLSRIARYSSVDEHLWTYERIPQFWGAVREFRWKKTNINDKPGITVALTSGFGMLAVNPQPYDSLRTEPKTAEQIALIKKINIAYRLPLYLFTLCMLPVFYILVKNLFGSLIALSATAITYLSPIILGISLVVNPDSLLWIFLPFSLLSFLVFLKNGENRYACLCGLFLGLALLTKYVAAILFVFLPILIFLEAIFSSHARDIPSYFRRSLLGYGKVIAVSLVTVTALYPAAWVRPVLLLKTTLLSHPLEPIWKPCAIFLLAIAVDIFLFKSSASSRAVRLLAHYRHMILASVFGAAFIGILFALWNTYTGMNLYDFESALVSARIKSESGFFSTVALQGIATGLYVLIFSVAPIVLLLFFLACLNGIRSIRGKIFCEETILASYLLLFMLLYYAASALNNVQATVRYQISLYPFAAIIAGVGLQQILQRFRPKRPAPPWLVALALIGLLALSLILIRPYYFAYASDLLPKSITLNMKDMGDGSFEAAQYLNSLPRAKQLHIWSDKIAVCEYFIGNCNVSLKLKNIESTYFDYFVISQGREPKSNYFISLRKIAVPEFQRLREHYASNDFDGHAIIIGERPENFVKIIKNTSSPDR